jgi:hypothetical protein
MARTSIWNVKFDRNQDFVVAKPFRVRGIDLVAGETFDKTMVTTRTLRQLFESRKLEVATVTTTASTTSGHGFTIKHLRKLKVETGATSSSAPSGGLTIQHLGFGRYAVFKGDVRLTPEPLTKAEAEAYAG